MKKIVSLFSKGNPLYQMLNDRAAKYALEKGLAYEWVPMDPFTPEKAAAALKEADAGIIDVEPYDKEIFSQICDRTKLLIRFGVGFDAVNLADATAYGIKVARTQGANAGAVAEDALLMMMALRRKLNQGQVGVKTGNWVKEIGHETIGATVGILGFGAVGKTLARLLRGFGCRILAYDTYHDKKAAAELGVEFVDADTIFQTCDAISIHLALNDETRGYVNAARLAMMKPDAVIVNTARGPLVDDEAMVAALKNHQIGGAGLDVFAEEPLPVTSPYIGLDNVILTPHVASSTVESLWNIYAMAIDVAYDFFHGTESAQTKRCWLN